MFRGCGTKVSGGIAWIRHGVFRDLTVSGAGHKTVKGGEHSESVRILGTPFSPHSPGSAVFGYVRDQW